MTTIGPNGWLTATGEPVCQGCDSAPVLAGYSLCADCLRTAVSEEVEPRCDICGEPDGPGEPDWNPETGNHDSCERQLAWEEATR